MYPIEQLIDFNPALIYGFDPESPPHTMTKPQDESIFSVEIEQHVDLLNAYLYAQNTILPFIKESSLDKITPEQLLEWVCQLHGFIGKSLLNEEGLKSGVYTDQEIVRWQQTVISVPDLYNFMDNIRRTPHASELFISSYSQKYKLDITICTVFASLTKRYHDQFISKHPELASYKGRSPDMVNDIVNSFRDAIINGGLSKEEQKALQQVVQFGTPVDQLSTAMEGFAKNVLDQWKNLRSINTIDEQAQILAEIFYQLTSIHPFPNANGRTATCLINIILKTINLPDIILRFPGQRNSFSSAYEKSMSVILETREPFAKHMANCIKLAKKTPYSNPDLAFIVREKVLLREEYKLLINQPAFNPQKFAKEVDKIIDDYLSEGYDKVFSKIRQHMMNTKENLLKVLSSSLSSFALPVNPLTLFQEGIKHYKNKLHAQAIESLTKSISGFQAKKGAVCAEVAKCYSSLGSVYRDNSNYQLAIETMEKALNCLEELKIKDYEAAVKKHGECLLFAGHKTFSIYQTAVSDYKEKHYLLALSKLKFCIGQWYNQTIQKEQLAICYSTLASCQRELGNIDDAINSCKQALELSAPEKQKSIQKKLDGLIGQLEQTVTMLYPSH
ncbi:MAG: Fic family protein [Legionella sp.]|nr:Fic family protein [Legionella sp.]